MPIKYCIHRYNIGYERSIRNYFTRIGYENKGSRSTNVITWHRYVLNRGIEVFFSFTDILFRGSNVKQTFLSRLENELENECSIPA